MLLYINDLANSMKMRKKKERKWLQNLYSEVIIK